MNQVPPYEFYTQKRWENWLERAKESGFQIKESEEEAGKESAIFVNMVDDVILACLKVTARFDKGMLSREKALEILAEVRDIVLAEVEPISEDIDLMIESVQTPHSSTTRATFLSISYLSMIVECRVTSSSINQAFFMTVAYSPSVKLVADPFLAQVLLGIE